MFHDTRRLVSLSLRIVALAGLLAPAGLAAAAPPALEYQYCNQVPSAFSGACEAACYKQRWDDLRDRAKCVDAWAKTGIPAHPCRSADFVATCESFKESQCNVYEKGDVSGHMGLAALNGFVSNVERSAAGIAAAQKLTASYAQCLGDAAYKEHKKRCMTEVKADKVAKCAGMPDVVKQRWADAVKATTERFIKVGIEKAAAGPDGSGNFPRAVALAEEAIETIAKHNANPLLAATFDAAALKAELESARKKGGDTASTRKAAQAKDRDEKNEAEANETAKSLPKAKMKNAKLAKLVKEIIEKQWPKDDFKKVIFSSKKWTTNYVYIGNYRTNRVASKSLDLHVITRPENGKFCRLYEVGVVKSRFNKQWGEVRWGGVGNSKWTLCPGE